jgi:hypothetical protein
MHAKTWLERSCDNLSALSERVVLGEAESIRLTGKEVVRLQHSIAGWCEVHTS